jgi:hypothetical protein
MMSKSLVVFGSSTAMTDTSVDLIFFTFSATLLVQSSTD